jgi:hypothetical protein
LSAPVQKVVPIPQSTFRVLVDRDDDCLDVLVTPTLSGSKVLDFGEGFNPRRVSPQSAARKISTKPAMQDRLHSVAAGCNFVKTKAKE